MPRRETRDPYKILVSEIMLQQTQVSRVLEKYGSFLKSFPTIRELAHAASGDVLRAWQGLGYNRRALLLKRCAEEVVERFGGVIPQERADLESLPGIGKATAGSMRAFAFNKPDVFIETNIRSVYIHHFFGDRSDVIDAALVPYIAKTLDRKNPREWYYALMDYGVYLKSIMPNPNRKSRHYTRQSRFEGSDRQIRGRALKILTEKRLVPKASLYKALGGDRERLEIIIAGLIKEGLIHMVGGKFFI